MRIQTGQGTIPLITLIGIWSISALNALPGLAVSPILGRLSAIFPHSTELDIQMLSSLPSLLIIPFIILSGKLTEKINNVLLLQVGLVIFSLSGILYMLSTKMWQLITVAITNITLVLATVLTGYLAEVNWHLPFVVYLFPLISIVLSFYLKKNISPYPGIGINTTSRRTERPTNSNFGKFGIQIPHLMQIMSFYGLATYLVIIISFNLPFLMKEYHFTSGNSGIMISLFFLAIMSPGFILNQIVSFFGKKTKFACMVSISVGMALILVSRTEWLIGLGCIFAGLGYGVIQPIAYDKTTRTAIPEKVTLALAFVMAMNYLAILLCPFIINILKDMLHIETQQFAFIFNMAIALIAAAWAYLKQDSFLFDDRIKQV